MLNLKEDGALKKLGLYSVGQTVTCFVKKVRSESSEEAASEGDLRGLSSDLNTDTAVVFMNCESGPRKVQCLMGRAGEGSHIFCT